MPSSMAGATSGNTFTAEEVFGAVVSPLLAQSSVLAALPPANLIQTNGVPLRIPKIDSIDISDPWRAENTAIAEVDPELGEVVLLPSTLKSVKILHRLSNELVRHSVVAIGDVLGQAFIQRLALILDRAFLVGPGTSNTVRGIAKDPDAQVLIEASAVTVDTLHTAHGMAMEANATPTCWFMPPKVLTALRKLKGSDGHYIVQPDPTGLGAGTLLGLPVYVTTQLPTDGGVGTNESTVVLADMNQVAVGRDQDIAITLLDQLYGNFDQLAIRVVGRFDIAALNPEGIVVLPSVKVS